MAGSGTQKRDRERNPTPKGKRTNTASIGECNRPGSMHDQPMNINVRRTIVAGLALASLVACTPDGTATPGVEAAAERTTASAPAPVVTGLNGLAEEQETEAAAAVAETARIAAAEKAEAERVAAAGKAEAERVAAEANRAAAEQAENAREQVTRNTGGVKPPAAPKAAPAPAPAPVPAPPAPPAPAPKQVSEWVTLTNRTCHDDGTNFHMGFTIVFSDGGTMSLRVTDDIPSVTVIYGSYGGRTSFRVDGPSSVFNGVGNC